ncbi:HNH endonuclease [Allorhizobium sp. BGMRC 0089]|nr:HNH endonuclease [Allorhizobium sonneratiae]
MTDDEMLIDANRLRSVIHYDPCTGEFRWIARRRGVTIGKKPGLVNGNGYREICIDGRLYSAQRLAWLYMTGEWPDGDVDHRDMDKLNNRWGNLRDASKAQNQANTSVRKSNTSGFKGVFATARHPDRWLSQIRVNGIKKHLGTFDTPEQAGAAYASALAEIHGEFGRI